MKPNPPTTWTPWSERTVITRQAAQVLEPDDVAAALRRHRRQDWGDIAPADRTANEQAVRAGARVLSAYRDRHGTRFWILTEADASVTSVLLPEEY